MGIDTKFYAVYGVAITDKKELEAFMDGPAGEDIKVENVLEGYCLDYIVFGPILYCSGSDRIGWEHGPSGDKIDISNLLTREFEYKKEFIKEFPEWAHWMNEPFTLICFMHQD